MSDDRLLYRELKAMCATEGGKNRLCSAIVSMGEPFLGNAESLRIAILKTMPYRSYLMTAHWREVSAKAKQRAGNRCQLCNCKGNLESHHRTYERRGHEEDADLTVLCGDCHGKYHTAPTPDDIIGPPVLDAVDMQLAGMSDVEQMEWFSKQIAAKRRQQPENKTAPPLSSILKANGRL
jgi:hypothetical protein